MTAMKQVKKGISQNWKMKGLGGVAQAEEHLPSGPSKHKAVFKPQYCQKK
jgi:hypothetical protein